MTDELSKLVASVNAMEKIGKRFSEFTVPEIVKLHHNLAYRRIRNIYFYEGIRVNTTLVGLLDLSDCILHPYYRIMPKQEKVTWFLLIQSIERYTDTWELALEKHKDNDEVQNLLTRYAKMAEEMNRMISFSFRVE